MNLPAILKTALPINPSTDAIVAAYMNTATRPKGWRGNLQIEKAISRQDRAALTTRHKAISDHLLDFDKKAVAAAVLDAMTSYRSFFKPEESDTRVKQQVVAKYVKELQGIPTWACVRACNTIRLGQAPGISQIHPFSAIQLRVLASSYIDRLREEAESISQLLRAEVASLPPDEETAKRVKLGLERLGFRLRKAGEKEFAERRAKTAPSTQEANQRSVLAEYAKAGEEPKFSGGILISPALLKSIKGKGG